MAGGRAIFALVLLLITVRGQDDVQNVTRSADEIYAPNPTLLDVAIKAVKTVTGVDPLGTCKGRSGTPLCPFTAGSDNPNWRTCINNVKNRCGNAPNGANSNTACPYCALFICAQTNRFISAGYVPDCHETQGTAWFYPTGADSDYTIATSASGHKLGIPKDPVWGVDDPNKLKYEFLWNKIWNQRGKVDELQWGAGINNQYARSMQQMHIHGDILAKGIRAVIDGLTAPKLGDKVNLPNLAGNTVGVYINFYDSTTKTPLDAHPFTAVSKPDRGILVVKGPNNKGFIVFDIGKNGVDEANGFFANKN